MRQKCNYWLPIYELEKYGCARNKERIRIRKNELVTYVDMVFVRNELCIWGKFLSVNVIVKK